MKLRRKLWGLVGFQASESGDAGLILDLERVGVLAVRVTLRGGGTAC